MDKIIIKIKANARMMVQLGFAALTNGYLKGFAKGTIYTGDSKALCVPGLNCYSCPGALGSCPIGSVQATLNSRNYKFAFYVFGFLVLIGAAVGRLVCGWLCPFGLVQDLLYRIPFVKKLRTLPGEKWLRRLRYLILFLFVILLPLFAVDAFGIGKPWFCAYICPSGTLMAGVPLVLANDALRSAVGFLYQWKLLLLIITLVFSIFLWRPFCRYICPLGAIYGLFNPVSLYRFEINKQKCTRCKVCQAACKMDIPVYEKPNSTDCVRCGVCKKACPHGAIYSTAEKQKKT